MYKYLKIMVVNFDDSNYPMVAYCNFFDSNIKVISMTEKLDILTNQNICRKSLPLHEYLLKCRILEEYEDSYKIDISDPYGVLDSNDNFIFIVEKNMLSNKHYDD